MSRKLFALAMMAGGAVLATLGTQEISGNKGHCYAGRGRCS
jgi:hypothetical protein